MNAYTTVALTVGVVFLADHMRMMIAQETQKKPMNGVGTPEKTANQSPSIAWLPGSRVSSESNGVANVMVPSDTAGNMRQWGRQYSRSYLFDAAGTPIKQGVMLLREDGTAFFLAGKEVDGGPYRVESTSITDGEVLHYFRPVNDNPVIVQAAYTTRSTSKRNVKS